MPRTAFVRAALLSQAFALVHQHDNVAHFQREAGPDPRSNGVACLSQTEMDEVGAFTGREFAHPSRTTARRSATRPAASHRLTYLDANLTAW